MNELVTTVSGSKKPRKECRKIRGIFYYIGDITVKDSGDCYKIQDRYYKSNTGYIIYDHRLNQYVVKKTSVIVENGIIGFNAENDPIFGAFSVEFPLEEPVIITHKGTNYSCVNEKILEDNFMYREDLTTGCYVLRTSVPAVNFFKPLDINQDIKRGLPYDSTGRLDTVKNIYNDTYNGVISPSIAKYGDIIRDLTYGLEFETTKGFIPNRICNKLGLMALRDGSIPGLEYVTIPLQGKKGMQTIVDTLQQLKKRTQYDDSCSLHIHIGNMPRTESFMLALMKVLYLIQDEMYGLFPLYKKDNYGVKRKHYTKPYSYADTVANFDRVITPDKVTENFGRLYKFLSMGQDFANVGSSIDKVKSHPSDPQGTAKWNIKSRYYWVNLIPLLFGNKQTVEFRLHTPTYDEYKVLNFLILCTSIINYVKDLEKSILEKPEQFNNINIHNIITYNDKGGKISDALYSYFRSRRDYYFKAVKNGDIVGKENHVSFARYINWDAARSKKSDSKVIGKTRKGYIYGDNPDNGIHEAFNRIVRERVFGEVREEVIEEPELDNN